MTTTRTLPCAFARHRRLRRSQALRDLVRETRLSPQDFVYPLFVTHGENVRRGIESMPGQYHLSVDQLAAAAAAPGPARREKPKACLPNGMWTTTRPCRCWPAPPYPTPRPAPTSSP